ncbi:VgrG-related protein [Kitasatospora sp. NPDC001664]
MAGETFANALTVEVEGRALPAPVAELLVSARVEDSRVVPDLFVLRFRDPNHTVLERGGLTIGSGVKLYAKAGDEPERRLLVSGEVTALEVDLDDTGTFTVVRGLDHSHRLFRGRRVVGYREMTASDIVRTVVRRAGLVLGTVDATRTVLPYTTQGNVTDWEFLTVLAAESGCEFAVVDGRFDFRKPAEAAAAPSPDTPVRASPYVLELGRNLLRCQAVVTSADQVHDVELRGWSVPAKQAVVARVPAGSTGRFALGLTPAKAGEPFGRPVLPVTGVPYRNGAVADTAARALAEEVASSFAELEVVAMGIPALRAGSAIALTNVGKPFEGRWTVTATRHVFDPGVGYQTWLTVGGGGTRPEPARRRERIHGVVNAVVTDIRDPEHQGRVKLSFPWLSEDYVSDWARSAQFGGKGGGGVFGPEVGDEVLVAFGQGLLDHPYVLGGLYNGQDHPGAHASGLVDSTSGRLNRRSLASRSGQRLELLDVENGPVGVRLASGDGKLRIDLEQQRTAITVHSDGTVTVEAREKVTVTGKGISLDAGGGELELSGRSVRVTARSGVQVDGGAGALKLQSNGQVDLKGATVGIDGRASTEIKGGASCSIQAALVRIN